ncbi:hypothetical protein U27_06762 [Candidatus Vecturithrix granuli]|uniref:Uncharacterized protein n=1 Tax=Vecturithrix granuli TaxID=1499967 RepID=A0A081C5C2_VECG1|nr:hypothetical protein U27_06762 [Candidatus Vecturithrix granuli]
MKSIYTITHELQEAAKMYADCMNAWGMPNGWDVVQAHLEAELREVQAVTSDDIPEMFREWPIRDLVLEVMNLRGGDQGRFAELELLKRLKQRSVFTIQGPASFVCIENGRLQFRSIPPFATFSGKFLAYHRCIGI